MSCGKRGCEYNRVLPNDGRVKSFRAKVHGTRNAVKTVVSFPNMELYSMAQKKRQVEKKHIKAFRNVYILSNGMDSHSLLRGSIYATGFVNACEYRTNLLNH